MLEGIGRAEGGVERSAAVLLGSGGRGQWWERFRCAAIPLVDEAPRGEDVGKPRFVPWQRDDEIADPVFLEQHADGVMA